MTLHMNPNHTTMSRQEILSWTSLAISISVLFFYILFVFGWPNSVPDVSDGFTKIFLNVLWIALAIELIIGLTESKTEVLKDERDEKIEAMGHKYAYGFLIFTIVAILFQMLLSNLFGEQGEAFLLLGSSQMVFHALVFMLFTSSIIKRGTMIYHYRKEV